MNLLRLCALVIPLSPPIWGSAPVTFDLSVDPSGVAIQFDIVSDDDLANIAAPQFEGTTAHSVRAASITSGAHRFVVYSLDGKPISESGRVKVVLPQVLAQQDGSIAISNVTASNANGQPVDAAPNALPVLTLSTRTRISFESGETFSFYQPVIDLDGSIQSVKLQSGELEIDSADEPPFDIEWGPVDSGSHLLSLNATDNRNESVTFDLGTYRAYDAEEITDYLSFAEVHFGENAPGSISGITSAPLNNGVANGLSYLLGLNPYTPDYTRLPQVELRHDEDGVALVAKFHRQSQIEGISWSAQVSHDLVSFEILPQDATKDIDLGNGSRSVEVKVPLDSGSNSPAFLTLEVHQP